MGKHVGAIPSMVGGHEIGLSHTGTVFHVTQESLKRWFRWVAHVEREQYLVWLPACFVGLALPSMLSVQFLPHGTILKDKWQAAGMTAGGVRDAVSQATNPGLGNAFWYMTLFCGLLILGTSMIGTADGVLRAGLTFSGHRANDCSLGIRGMLDACISVCFVSTWLWDSLFSSSFPAKISS